MGGSFKFQFNVDNCKLGLTIGSGTYKTESGEEKGIIVGANYHEDISPEASTEEIISLINEYSIRKDHFLSIVNGIFSDIL